MWQVLPSVGDKNLQISLSRGVVLSHSTFHLVGHESVVPLFRSRVDESTWSLMFGFVKVSFIEFDSFLFITLVVVANYCNERVCVCVSVCLSVCPSVRLSLERHAIFTYFLHVVCGHGSVLVSSGRMMKSQGEWGQFWGFSSPLTMHCCDMNFAASAPLESLIYWRYTS